MSLFKRPAWAQTQDSADVTEKDIFSHTSRSYSDVVAEEHRRKKERIAKEKARQERKERKSLDKQRIKLEEEQSGSAKRRRITLEEGENLLGKVGLSPVTARKPSVGSESEEEDASVVPRRSPRFNKVRSREDTSFDIPREPKNATVISLGDSEDEEEAAQVQASEPKQQHEDEEEEEQLDEESDEELAALTRQARARKRLKDAAKASATPDAKSPTPGQDRIDFSRGLYPTPPLPDPTVKLFISSDIPGTKPLMVYRKLSQRLQEIREVWCEKQQFTKERAQQVFLIHRGRRVYDVTTCKSLGLEVGSDGETIVMKGADGMDGVEKVHLEAVTDEIFAQLKAGKAEEERKRQALLMPEDDLEAGVEAGVPSRPEDQTIKIMLKAKGHSQPHKLIVKPSTLFSKIMKSCRTHFQIPENKTLYLEFDGERLDPDDAMSSTDVESLDCIDVHVS